MSISKQVIITVVITFALSTYFTYTFCKHNLRNTAYASALQDTTEWATGTTSCDFNIKRMRGLEYIKPLLYVELKNESANLASLKSKINDEIEKYKKAGVLQSASVFLRVYQHGSWMSINDTEMYLPGSLIKVAGLLTYLRMEEINPGTFNKRLSFTSPKEFIPNQTFNSKQIELGKSYTVKELLKYMIAYSDNNATYLLNKKVDNKVFLSLFKDLGLTVPDLNKPDFKMNVREYSIFLRVLYNSSYLSMEHSEFGAELLAQCDFTKGMVSGLPADVKIAHKFGEMGDATTRQLHESGIIYNKNTHYVLTVMTKGYDVNQLPPVISSITKLVNQEMDSNPEFAATAHADYQAGSDQIHSK